MGEVAGGADERGGGAKRVAVVMPTWLGDAVMATPTLRALRGAFAGARIDAWCVGNLRSVLRPMRCVDRVRVYDKRGGGLWAAARRMRRTGYDVAVVLPNSWRAGLLVWLGGAKRRVGYDRDGRGVLLTDRLIPRKEGGRYVPVPTLDYYLGIARYLGAEVTDASMRVATLAGEDARAAEVLGNAECRMPNDEGGAGDGWLVMNPGAAKVSKRWPAERFAAVAGHAVERHGLRVAVTGGPGEAEAVGAVVRL
ncbi:MAG: glycosyltransferase family 9 protein, partial [Planctomycetota bacterium]